VRKCRKLKCVNFKTNNINVFILIILACNQVIQEKEISLVRLYNVKLSSSVFYSESLTSECLKLFLYTKYFDTEEEKVQCMNV
jgi:hypothetical protein